MDVACAECRRQACDMNELQLERECHWWCTLEIHKMLSVAGAHLFGQTHRGSNPSCGSMGNASLSLP